MRDYYERFMARLLGDEEQEKEDREDETDWWKSAE